MPGFIARHLRFGDATNWPEVRTWNSSSLNREFARHQAWRVRARMDEIITQLPFDSPPEVFRDALAQAIGELELAKREL